MKPIPYTLILALLLAACAPAVGAAPVLPTATLLPTPTIPATATNAPTATATAEPTPTLAPGDTDSSAKDRIVMVYVPTGSFTMGSDTGDGNEKPVHVVSLDAFWIDQTEVTTTAYASCVAAGACSKPRSTQMNIAGLDFAYDWSVRNYADYPILGPTWEDADAYCRWAGERLPTEAEWEKAARGTDSRTYPWGEESPSVGLIKKVNLKGRPLPVGFPGVAGASPYGALGMAGNAWEFVSDWYDAGYYSKSPASNPSGPAAGYGHVVRGGSFMNVDYQVRTTYRSWDGEGGRWINAATVSFRCVRPAAP